MLPNDNITGATAKALNTVTPTEIIITSAPTSELNGTYTLILPNIYTNGTRYIRFQTGTVTFHRTQLAAENNV